VRVARGSEGRDALWEHPDFLPTAEDLDSPEAIQAFVVRSAPLDLSGLDDLPEAPTGGDDAEPEA